MFHLFSPYRVCPLGAHVDHQHGLVTGFAFEGLALESDDAVVGGFKPQVHAHIEGEACNQSMLVVYVCA